MNFLTGIIVAIAEWFLAKLFALAGKEFGEWKAEREIAKEAKEDQKKIEGAKTDEERAKAGSDSARDTFGR
jgi:hypothetical protein